MGNHMEHLERGRFAEQCRWLTRPEFRQALRPTAAPRASAQGLPAAEPAQNWTVLNSLKVQSARKQHITPD